MRKSKAVEASPPGNVALRRDNMTGGDWATASLLILVWASNFVVAAIGIKHVGPLALATLRFLFSAFPALLFVRFPRVALWRVAAFGLLFGLGQFGLLFVGIHQGVSVSIAALVIQMQAFFTVLFAALLFAEKISRKNVLAFLIAASGLLLIGLKGGQSAPLIGILFILGGAASWALCNMIGRQVDRPEMVRFIIWSCVFAVPPLLLMTIIFEGYRPLLNSIVHPEPGLAAIVFWQAWANSRLIMKEGTETQSRSGSRSLIENRGVADSRVIDETAWGSKSHERSLGKLPGRLRGSDREGSLARSSRQIFSGVGFQFPRFV